MENESPGWFSNHQARISLLLIASGSLLLVLAGVWFFRTLWSANQGRGRPPSIAPAATHAAWVTATPTLTPADTDSSPGTPTPAVLSGEQPGDSGTIVPTPTLTLTPTPTVIPTQVPLLPIGEDTIVFALLGTDEEQPPGSWRTDAIILAFVEPGARRVSLLSVPRDLWVYIPGCGHERINTVDTMGGLALLDRTFRYNLSVPVHHSVRMNWQGFARIVDAMGGVTVAVEEPLVDRIPDPLSESGWFDLALEKGLQHLDGQTALAYCRSRLTTSDFDRSRRQRQVLLALWQQAFTVEALSQAPELWAALGDSFETDLDVGQGLQLAQALMGLDAQHIRSASLSAAAEQWTTPDGAWVLLPKPDAIRQTILDLLSTG